MALTCYTLFRNSQLLTHRVSTPALMRQLRGCHLMYLKTMRSNHYVRILLQNVCNFLSLLIVCTIENI